MKIIQVLPYLCYGDAIGNDAIAKYKTLKKAGYQTGIYAENVDRRIRNEKVTIFDRMPKLSRDDIILYHLSTTSELNHKVAEFGGRLVIVFHNVTPGVWFRGYEPIYENACNEGWRGVAFLSDKAGLCIADSEYNKQNLIEQGYTCPIHVIPVEVRFSDYDKEPSHEIINQYEGDGYTNLLFTGRVVPNKKQEDLISVFYYFQKYYCPRSRLFIVGNEMLPLYTESLKDYVSGLSLSNVIFTGHIPFSDILAYYKIADLFLCMSEHEGFCVPLLEAMYFGVPIVAYDSTAVGETMGNGGILYKGEKSFVEIAGLIHRVLEDRSLLERIKANEKERLAHFAHEKVEQSFLAILQQFIAENEEAHG